MTTRGTTPRIAMEIRDHPLSLLAAGEWHQNKSCYYESGGTVQSPRIIYIVYSDHAEVISNSKPPETIGSHEFRRSIDYRTN